MNTAPIFQTMTTTGLPVAVAIESHGPSTMPLLVVRDTADTVQMALPVVHVSRAILSSLFDEIDCSGILFRVNEVVPA